MFPLHKPYPYSLIGEDSSILGTLECLVKVVIKHGKKDELRHINQTSFSLSKAISLLGLGGGFKYVSFQLYLGR